MVSGFFTSPCDQSRIFCGAASLMRMAPKVMGFGCRSRIPHRSFVGFSSRTRLPNVRSVNILSISFWIVRLGRRGPSPATSCSSPYIGSFASDGGAPAPRRPAAHPTLDRSPRTAGPQPRDVLPLTLHWIVRLGRRGPSPATSCRSPYIGSFASDGGAPAPRRPAAHPTLDRSPRTAGPQPRDVLPLTLHWIVRLGRRGPSPATSCRSPYIGSFASDGGAPAPRRPAAHPTLLCSPRTAGPQPRDVLQLTLHCFVRLGRRG